MDLLSRTLARTHTELNAALVYIYFNALKIPRIDPLSFFKHIQTFI